MTSHTITLIANIALAISVVIGLIFGIVQVKTAARDRQERLTLEALRNFNTREFSELMNYVTSHVNSVTPGYTATGLNDFKGLKSVQEGAKPIVRLVPSNSEYNTGKFFREEGTLPW